MASYEERIYELGAEALAEQERTVGEVRSRAAALLAAGAVIPSLLARSIFHAQHPTGWMEVGATIIGLSGATGVLVSAVLLLRPYELGFSVQAGTTYRALRRREVLDQPNLDIVLAEAFDEKRRENAKTVKWLVRFLAAALTSLVVEAIFLGLAAALAS